MRTNFSDARHSGIAHHVSKRGSIVVNFVVREHASFSDMTIITVILYTVPNIPHPLHAKALRCVRASILVYTAKPNYYMKAPVHV